MRMSTGKMLLVVFAAGFFVFFGLDVAGKGMERVQGPAAGGAAPAAAAVQPGQVGQGKPQAPNIRTAATVAAAHAPTATQNGAKSGQSGKAEPAKTVGKPQKEPVGIEVKESFVNQVSSGIGDALRQGARLLIGLVVSLFDAIVR